MDTTTKEQMTQEEIGIKIVHLLKIYPIISPTMLQSGLGPQLKPAQWRPVLTTLIEQGKVIETKESMQTPSSRYNTYSKLALPGTKLHVEQ